MAIHTIVGDIELAALKPADVEIVFRVIGVLHPREVFHPIDAPADAAPEPIGILDGFVIHLIVLSPLDERPGRKRLRNRISISRHLAPPAAAPVKVGSDAGRLRRIYLLILFFATGFSQPVCRADRILASCKAWHKLKVLRRSGKAARFAAYCSISTAHYWTRPRILHRRSIAPWASMIWRRCPLPRSPG